MLGVPTVADRVAQTVVAMFLEPLVEPRFHQDSYGHRPSSKSAHARAGSMSAAVLEVRLGDRSRRPGVLRRGAVGPHRPRAVEAVTDCRWVLLYVKRWLQAPLEHPNGALSERHDGNSTRIGGLAGPGEPVLALRVRRLDGSGVPGLPVRALRRRRHRALHDTPGGGIRAGPDRRADAGEGRAPKLHPDKTRIVYCKDSNRRGQHEHTSFTFLGFAFRPRKAVNGKTGEQFTSFSPAISPEALKAKGDRLRKMRIHRRTDLTLNDLAAWLNPIVAGWMRYYGRFYRSALDPLLRRVSFYLRRWAGKEIQATASPQAIPAVVGRAAGTRARAVHPLAVGPRVLTRPVRRAR